jgi:hypothetical protein
VVGDDEGSRLEGLGVHVQSNAMFDHVGVIFISKQA